MGVEWERVTVKSLETSGPRPRVPHFPVAAAPDKSCTAAVVDDRQPVSFATWKDALAASGIEASTQAEYRSAIIAFLHHCKVEHAPATIMLAKQYIAERERQGAKSTRLALRWFFQQARATRPP